MLLTPRDGRRPDFTSKYTMSALGNATGKHYLDKNEETIKNSVSSPRIDHIDRETANN
jgi:hypothetical protein